jgi:hypothetical protein
MKERLVMSRSIYNRYYLNTLSHMGDHLATGTMKNAYNIVLGDWWEYALSAEGKIVVDVWDLLRNKVKAKLILVRQAGKDFHEFLLKRGERAKSLNYFWHSETPNIAAIDSRSLWANPTAQAPA